MSYGLEDGDVAESAFFGLCSSKIDGARACPATSERGRIVRAVFAHENRRSNADRSTFS